MVYALASLSGPVIGGLFAEYLHWSLIFWINLPLGIIALSMTNRTLARLPRHERPHQLDLAGAALMMAAGFVLLLALTWGGTRYAWNSQPIWALLAGSLIFWLFRAPEPFLPLPLLFDRVVALGTGSVSFVFGTMIGLSIFVPMYFEQLRGLSVSQSGLALIPLMGGSVLGSTLSGRCIGRLVHYKRVPLLGLAAAIAGTALIAADPSGQRLLVVVVALAGVGTGIGTLYPVTTVSVQNAVPLHQLGIATGAMNFFRQLAGAIVVAGFAAIVLHGAGNPYVPMVGAQAVAGIPRPDLIEAFRWVFVAAAIALGAGLLCLVAMEERPLRGRMPSSAAATVAGE
jgi:MFS family permease